MDQQITTTFIATVAGGPQIVTFALDELIRQGAVIHEVIAVHLSPQTDPLIGQALAKLATEFTGNQYQGLPCRLYFHPIRWGIEKLDDIYDDTTANIAWSSIYQLVAGLKADKHRLHACVAGSRRILALLFMSAAMLHFDHQDKLWHMYTPHEFLERARNGAIMHAQPEDGVQLIQVPMIPLGAYFPGIRELTQAAPSQVIATQMRWLDQSERSRCQEVIEQLTSAQLEVLRAFATGMTPQQVAETLHIELTTVDSHKTPILAVCRTIWAIPDEVRLTYHFLHHKFEPFLSDLL
jgi:CRISPR-associated protein Csx14